MTMAARTYEPELHVSIMVREVLEAFDLVRGGTFLDLTAGYGGHSAAILEHDPEARLIAFDRDPEAVKAASRRLLSFGERVRVIHAPFTDIEGYLREEGIDRVDGVLADLGVSSPQLDTASRGMSFRNEGPLDMRMDPSSGETVRELIERLSTEELADVIYQYGEERRSRRVARCIKQAVQAGHMSSTFDLRRAVVKAVGPRRERGIDPATRTFQALRVAVNSELEQLSQVLGLLPRLLREGGVAAFISFHSLEDRQVKRAFLDRRYWERVTRKPMIAGEQDR